MDRHDALRFAIHVEELTIRAAFDERDAFVADGIKFKGPLKRFVDKTLRKNPFVLIHAALNENEGLVSYQGVKRLKIIE